MAKRVKVILNVNWDGEIIRCAKSPALCKDCPNRYNCERLEFYYYPFENALECMQARSYSRHKGAIKERI